MRTLSRFIGRAYKFVIVAWILIGIVTAILALRLPGMLKGDGFNMDAENVQVMNMVIEQFGISTETMLLVFDKMNDEQIAASLERVEALGIVDEVTSPLENRTQHSAELSYAVLHFTDTEQDMSAVVTKIRKAVTEDSGVTLTGYAAISKDINEASQRDLMVAEAIGLPIAILVLLFAFGSVVASLVPLIIGLSAVVTSLGILTLMGGYVDLSIFVLNIVPMLGLALSIDFALLFISRFREERKKHDPKTSMMTTMRTAGRAIIFSAFCVFIGLGAMLIIQVDIFRDIAIGGMLIVSIAVLSSLTLLPSVLLALGERIDKWQVIKVRNGGADRWRKFANAVIKRPVLITLVAVIILGIALIPVRNMDLTIPQIDSLPESNPSRSAYEAVNKEFKLAETSHAYVVVSRPDGWEHSEGFEQIKQFERDFEADSFVKDAMTIYSVSGIEAPEQWEQMWDSPMRTEQLEPLWESFVQGEQLLIPITLDGSGSSDEAQAWVKEFGTKYPELEVLVGGEAKFNQEIFDEIADKLWIVLTVIMLSTLIVLMIAFKSILIPIKAILMNVFGLAATFGILVYIFQYGHFGLPAGTIALIIPVIVFSLVFGLSMDYEVFLISRMQEEYAQSHDNDRATVEGLAVTSKIITSAALIMIVLTGSFAIADVMPVKQIGVGIAIAVALDASIIRLLLVPSLMKLLGKWNWWMPFRKGPYRLGKHRH